MRQLPGFLLVLLLVLIPARAGRAEEQGLDLERIGQVLTGEVEKLLENGTASVSICLVRAEEIVWTEAFGHANVKTGTLATPATIYVTGSTFKAVTATALMQLVEEGEIDLDDPVNDHLVDAKIADQAEHPVTIRHILSHVSGLQPGAKTVRVWDRELPVSLQQLSAGLHSIRPPEEKYEYNNNAYGLAGYLIEQVTGTDYETYIVEQVLRPLGVTTPSPVNPTPEMVELLALPYAPSADGPRPVAQTRYDVFPAGDIYLTAEDIARFLGAHLNGGTFQGGRILSPESVKECHRRQFFDYGLGWSIGRGRRSQTIAHGGGVSGFTTFMLGDTQAKVGAYVMTNSGDAAHIARVAVALLRGEEYVPQSERPSVAIAAETLDRYVGVFRLSEQFSLTVSRDGQRLFVQGTGQGRHELFASSETDFFLKAVDAEVVFHPGDDGTVDRLVLRQGGDHTGTRVQ